MTVAFEYPLFTNGGSHLFYTGVLGLGQGNGDRGMAMDWIAGCMEMEREEGLAFRRRPECAWRIPPTSRLLSDQEFTPRVFMGAKVATPVGGTR